MDGTINWCTAEVLRAKGETLLDSGNADAPAEAEKPFLRSIDIGRQQKALSRELRGATSWARLRHDDGRKRQARDPLNAVYARFAEGFARRDSIEASELLEVLD
jgi:hypothetical protein